MPYSVDSSNPADDGIVGSFPANERASRAAIEASLGVEHTVATGRHLIGRGTTTARDAAITAPVAGNVWINTTLSPERWQWYGSAWTSAAEFASGTKMVFYQAAAPTGWTRDATNDRVIRVVSTGGGDTGGSWTISGLTNSSYTLATADIPAHTHSFAATSGAAGAHTPAGTISAGTHSHTATTDSTSAGTPAGSVSGGSHTHTGTTATEGSHTHTGTTSSDGAHTHGAPKSGGGSGAHGSTSSDNNAAEYTTWPTDSQGSHTHSFTSGAGSAHSHTFTSDATSPSMTFTGSALAGHTHTLTTGSTSINDTFTGTAVLDHTHSVSGTSGSAGGGGGHTHTLAADSLWRPAYANCLIAAKD